MMIILRQRLAAVVPGGSPTSRLLKHKGKTRKQEEVKVIVTSTAVFSPPDSSQQPHSHAQTNVHQILRSNHTLMHKPTSTNATTHCRNTAPKPRDNRNSRNAQFAHGENRKQQERDKHTERGRVHEHRPISKWTVGWKTEKTRRK